METEELLDELKSKGTKVIHVPMKLRGKVQISYDVNSLPDQVDMEDIIEFYNESGWLIYSGNTGNRPQWFANEPKKQIVKKKNYRRRKKDAK